MYLLIVRKSTVHSQVKSNHEHSLNHSTMGKVRYGMGKVRYGMGKVRYGMG